MSSPEFCAGILQDATTEETAEIGQKLTPMGETELCATDDALSSHLTLAERIDIVPGEIRVSLSAERLAGVLNMDEDRVVDGFLILTSPFQHRKRGVETKLIIGNEPAEIDETLLRNIGRGHRFFELVVSGRTLDEVATIEGVSKHRIKQVIELAFLAPDVIRSVREGRQPVGLTSDWLMRHAFSPVWTEQREMFAAL